jgi:glycerophosphoryl diester phosphodiesterase
MVIPRNQQGALLKPTALVNQAHAAGLLVHIWTLRAENYFLPTDLRNGSNPATVGDLDKEIAAYLAAGVDGFFSDHPDIGVRARNAARKSASR